MTQHTCGPDWSVCEFQHAPPWVRCVQSSHMEIFLNLWDELDDLVGACRHIATSVALEAADVVRPLVALIATVPLGWLWSLKNLI